MSQVLLSFAYKPVCNRAVGVGTLKAQDRSIEEWFSRVSSGQVRLPRFQRFEAWGHKEVSDLLQTVLDELPSGATLILEVGDKPLFEHRPIQSAPTGPERLTELLLDGQQRLTALWRSLNDNYEDRSFFVDLSSDNEETGGYSVVSQHRYQKGEQRYPLWANDPKQTLDRRLLPMWLLYPSNAGAERLDEWIEKATEDDKERYELYKLAAKLRGRIANFNLPYLFLSVGTDKATTLSVFVKMNTRQMRLTAFDIVVAEVEAATGESLHDLVTSLNGQVPELARYSDLPDLVLDVAAILQDRPPNQAGYFNINWSEMINRWDELVVGAEQTVKFLEQEQVLDSERLPSRAPLAPLIALWTHAPQSPDQLGNARTLLKRYLWRAFFTERYEKAAATAALQDYRALLPAIQNGSTTASAPIFDFSLPTEDELLTLGWPKKRDRIARGVLLLSFQGGALDLADGSKITPANVKQREYHHLFPSAYLKEMDTTEAESNSALNCALVTWRTNRTISSKKPLDYLRDRVEASSLGQEALKHRLHSHAIPFDTLSKGDFDGFQLARAQLCAEAVNALCEGKEWTPLASLDQ